MTGPCTVINAQCLLKQGFVYCELWCTHGESGQRSWFGLAWRLQIRYAHCKHRRWLVNTARSWRMRGVHRSKQNIISQAILACLKRCVTRQEWKGIKKKVCAPRTIPEAKKVYWARSKWMREVKFFSLAILHFWKLVRGTWRQRKIRLW